VLLKRALTASQPEPPEGIPVRRKIAFPFPVQTSIADASRPVRLEEQAEGAVQHGELLIALTRFPQGMPERKTEKERPWRRRLLSDLTNNGQ